ncbi:beta-galactosidase [Cohnella sp. GCM10027633]|uniref:beta-galactosidase n=1 Tax=unclassified Cohnella TaxID=2636738 RepID=UPI003643DE13
MIFGVCYYPEHWPEERWETDARLMKEAGINVVRVAEFAWSKFERYEGRYDFDWLDRSIAILQDAGIQVVLGTPTATPPKWLMDKHPDIYMKDAKGIVRGFGHRRHYCYNNPNYRVRVTDIVTRMANHYGRHEAVIAWQIDNEFGCTDTTRCYCDNCKSAFREWLRAKYGDIDSLNESWGTVFWSQIYNDFEQIELPGYTVFPLHNPGMELDFRRFSSDSAASFQQLQLDILRERAPGVPLTHNMMGMFNEIDCFKLSEPLDFASLDTYPNLMFTDKPDPRNSAIHLDATRGFKDANFWVMEHQSGAPGGNLLFPTPKPGELRKWTYQSVARGADAIVYFRWRTCLFGAEQSWHGLLPHDGIPGRRYEEAAATGRELQALWPLLEGSRTVSEIAIIRSYDNEWALEIQPQTIDHHYDRHFKTYYKYFYDQRIPVDIVSEHADFGKYKLVVLPHFMMADHGTAEKIEAFVAAGGTVVLDVRSGIKRFDNRMEERTFPGPYRELLGVRVSDYGTIRKNETLRIADANGREGQGTTWYDELTLEGAEAIAWFAEDYVSGKPAAARNAFGEGHAYYFGVGADPGLMKSLMEPVVRDAGVVPIDGIEAPDADVELMCRQTQDRRYVFAINHAAEEKEIDLSCSMTVVPSGERVQGAFKLPPYGAVVFETTL